MKNILYALLLICITGKLYGQEEIIFSPERGFYETPVNVTLGTTLSGATIRFTLDGTAPSPSNGTIYSTPIAISGTSNLRAIAYSAIETLGTVTHTYIFLDDIITDTSLKTYITQDPVWGTQLKDALLAIPSISIVSDSIINAGINVSGSMEMLFPDGEDNFQANCGLGNYGNHSLNFTKRNIRMYFDSIYGPKNLKQSLFEGYENGVEPIEKFDKLDLRSSHETWIWNNGGFPWHEGETYITTKLMDDIMLRGGSVNPHNRFVHVYLDGQYWGQFDLREKFDDNMLADYLGGDDYDFISGSKVTVSAFYPEDGILKDGSGADWQALVDSSDDYLTWKTMVNENSFFDMMLLFMYGFAEAEWNATGAPSIGKEFHFQVNDADLFFSRGYPQWTNRTYPQHSANGPNNMFLRLFNEGHPDFFQDFADRASLMFDYDGALTPATLRAHMDEIVAIIEESIIGEAAKWSGDSSENPTQWREKIDSFKVNMVDIRRDVVVGQMKKTGVYPTLDPASFSVPEGLVAANIPVDITNPNAAGTIYYTLDGTDPRASGGSINPMAQSYQGTLTIAEGVIQINARIKGQETTYPQINIGTNKPITASQTTHRPATDANDGAIWGINHNSSVYVTANGGNPWLEIDLQTVQDIDIVRVWGNSAWAASDRFIAPYIFISNQPFNTQLIADLLTDPNVQAFPYNGNGADVFEIPVNTQGRYVRVMADQSTNFFCSEFEIIQIDNTNPTVKDIWSPMVPQTYYTNQDYTNIVINEIHYNQDSTRCGTDSLDVEFLEIVNARNTTIDLSGCTLADGVRFKFPYQTLIQPNDFIVLAEDTADFYAAYGTTAFGQYIGALDNSGEYLAIIDPFGNLIDSVKYNDKNPWDEDPDGDGTSLELLHPTLDNNDPINWFRSDNSCGTPGAANSRVCTGTADQIVINEINYNSNNGITDPGDWVEFHNPNATPTDISGWTFYDNNNEFIFPSGTIIQPDDYLVLVENDAMFGSIFPHLTANEFLGNFTFGLSNKGERVSLFDNNKCLSDYVIYNDKIPWDTIPDGNGPTLSLITPTSDNTLPQSWEASSNINSAYGTPGRANEPCLENVIELPNLICAGFPTEIKVDSAYSEMDFTWFVSGATPANFIVDSETVTWNNPGTYNIQLITKYFECTKVYTQSVTVEDCNTIPNIIDDNFSINEDNSLSDNVLTNDSDPDNDNLTVNTPPQRNVSNGTLTLNADGTFDYTPNPDFYGTDSFTYEVCDDATFNETILGNFSGQVISSADDVEELSTDGSINVSSSDLDLLEDSPDVFSAVGIRMTNITVPQGATVTSAYLEFVADEAQSVATSINISAEATGNAPTIPATAYALTSKNKTNATASWANLPAWTIGNTYQSTDISPVVQELINRGDWASGNAMTFILEGTGTRTAESFDGTAAPKLFINYETISQTPTDVSLCDTAVVVINISPKNDAPQAANDDLTVNEDIAKTGNVISNDSDVDSDNLSVNITPIIPPQNGSYFLLASGFYSYTPNADFYGTDTFEYEICDDGSPVLCDTASVTIDVTPVNDAPTPTSDTLSMFANSSIQDNVLLNDSDIENDGLTATITPIIAPSNGTLIIQPNGNIDYTPNPNFVGTDSFTYEVCDDGTPSMCNTETVTILIEPDCVDIELAVWLEGAFDPALGEMRNTLVATRKLLPGQTPASNLATPTPAGQPYSAAPWNYTGTEGIGWTDADYTGDETDWVLVSFRTGTAKNTEVSMTAALLMKDGSITFPDRCALTSMVASPLYILIEHRNHIGIMTPQPIDLIGSTLAYDFRSSNSYRDPTSFGQKQLPIGEWTMFAGDADQSDFPSFDIQGTDKTLWFQNNGVFDYYLSPDFNLDGDINGQDKSLWFDNNGISSRVPK